MITFLIILAIYLAGFVFWFRNRLRVYLNNWDNLSNYQQQDYNTIKPVLRHFGATVMALFWPITFIVPLLAATVKTDKQIRESQEKRARDLELVRTALKRQAKELNLPGWQDL